MARMFQLVRDEDVTGVSGTGVVAEGIEFTGGVVALRWLSEWPTSVVFHERGMESVEAVHGHNGKTRIVWAVNADDIKVAVCERMIAINADEPEYPIIPPTAIDWIGDALVSACMAAVVGGES